MKRFFLPAVFLVLVLPLCAGGAEETASVWITASGARYHRRDCSTLRNSASVRAVSLEEAAGEGKTPCAVCNPAPVSGTGGQGGAVDGLYRLNMSGPDGNRLRSVNAADRSRMIPATVSRHVDGDTVALAFASPPPGIERAETIRMIGVDTPETVHPTRGVERFGREASDYTKRRLLGRQVLIAFDWNLRDRYGRLLCYIFTEDGCFNAELVREGYGHAYTSFSFQFMDEFRALERSARENHRGLWGAEAPERYPPAGAAR